MAGPENMVEFAHLFTQQTRKNLNDEHIWFSIVTRPPQSRFTRLQRLSCCLCLLFTSMLANAMYYERTSDGAGQNALVIGPFALPAEQVRAFVAESFVWKPCLCMFVDVTHHTHHKVNLAQVHIVVRYVVAGASWFSASS